MNNNCPDNNSQEQFERIFEKASRLKDLIEHNKDIFSEEENNQIQLYTKSYQFHQAQKRFNKSEREIDQALTYVNMVLFQ
jgi:hypothetical protein